MKLEKLEEMELIDQFAFLEARSQNFVFPIYFHQQKVLFWRMTRTKGERQLAPAVSNIVTR